MGYYIMFSIDIYPLGKNKGQIIGDFDGPIHFFGDRVEKGGNDYELARLLQKSPHKVTAVADWHETFAHLKKIF